MHIQGQAKISSHFHVYCKNQETGGLWQKPLENRNLIFTSPKFAWLIPLET